MNKSLPLIYLARHGETEWTLTGQHTGRSDIPLTPRGESDAVAIGNRLRGIAFDRVFSSPLARARRTCEIANLSDTCTIDHDLVEWDYGQYEGKRTLEIRAMRPGWKIFRDGCPGGESPGDIAARADRAIDRWRARDTGNTLVFAHGHMLRIIAARWLSLPPEAGQSFTLSTSSISTLGYDHGLDEPAVRLWNDTGHLHR